MTVRFELNSKKWSGSNLTQLTFYLSYSFTPCLAFPKLKTRTKKNRFEPKKKRKTSTQIQRIFLERRKRVARMRNEIGKKETKICCFFNSSGKKRIWNRPFFKCQITHLFDSILYGFVYNDSSFFSFFLVIDLVFAFPFFYRKKILSRKANTPVYEMLCKSRRSVNASSEYKDTRECIRVKRA